MAITQPRIPWRDALIILLIALAARVLLLASGTVSFHSDEAVIGLMARHIIAGARPTFFYGQAYMGSLDAWLIALGFRLLGDSLLTIRIVQSLLYLLVVGTGYLLAWRISEQRLIAAVTGLLMAVPAVNTALYTTATLGGYNETLLFGNLILLLAFSLSQYAPRSIWRWAALGFIAGLGWWTLGLIVIYIVPGGLLILWQQRRNPGQIAPFVALAGLAFMVGSAPWWVYDFSHDHAALATLFGSASASDLAAAGLTYVPPSLRALGLIVIGLPGLMGLRFPWDSAFFLLPLGLPVLLIYAAAFLTLLRAESPLKPGGRLLILLLLVAFSLIFIFSRFRRRPYRTLSAAAGAAAGRHCRCAGREPPQARPAQPAAAGPGAAAAGLSRAGADRGGTIGDRFHHPVRPHHPPVQRL